MYLALNFHLNPQWPERISSHCLYAVIHLDFSEGQALHTADRGATSDKVLCPDIKTFYSPRRVADFESATIQLTLIGNSE
jgi:hypothetical protein